MKREHAARLICLNGFPPSRNSSSSSGGKEKPLEAFSLAPISEFESATSGVRDLSKSLQSSLPGR